MTLSVDADQLTLAARASVQMVTLVELTTFSDYEAQTVDETFYYATVPIRYQWDGANTVQFNGPLAAVTPIARGFPHIPNAADFSTRDGMRIVFDASEWAGEFPWNRLTSTNLLGARVVVASLLVDWPRPLADDWQDLSALGDVHVVRFRGEVTDVPEYDDEGNQFELVFDSIEPTLPWKRALDIAEVSEKDLGVSYPIPVGNAKRVPLVQRQVGWVTTLVSNITDQTLGPIFVTDAAGFPAAPTQFAVMVGSERIIATKIDSVAINIVARGFPIGSLTTDAAYHNAGAVMVEEIATARFVYSGVENLGISALYARSPQTGELVGIPAGFYGFVPADKEVDSGTPLGVVSFTQELWARVIQLLNEQATVAQQPEFASTATSTRTDTPTLSTAIVVPSFAFLSTFTDAIISGGTVEARYNAALSEAGVIYWLDADLGTLTDVVTRYRIVFDYRIRAEASNTTYGQISFKGGFLGADSSHNFTLLAGSSQQNVTGAATGWVNCPSGTTVGDASNDPTAFDDNGPRIHVTLANNIFSGGGGSDNQFEVTLSTVSLEMEIAGTPIARTFDVVTNGAQELGFNLDMFADIQGAATIGSETSLSEFDDSTGWTGFDATISDVGASGDGFTVTGDGTAVLRTAAIIAIVPDLDFSDARVRFDYQLSSATLDLLELDATAFRITLLSTAGNFVRWAWPKSVLHHTGWREFTFDPAASPTMIQAFEGTLDLSAVDQINIDWVTQDSADTGSIDFRDLRSEARTHHTHPIDVAEWFIEENCGVSGGADATTFATAKTNLPSLTASGDLRNAGSSFAEVLARIGYESRTNFVPSESATQQVFKAYNALTTLAFAASTRTLDEFAKLRTRTKTLLEQPNRFIGLYNFTNEFPVGTFSGYRALVQANETTNDISGDVPTVDITDAQDRVGIRESDEIAFILARTEAGVEEMFAYYVQEALRGDAQRLSMKVPYRLGYDLEPGDIVSIQPRWAASALKCRVIQTIFASDQASIGLNLEVVL